MIRAATILFALACTPATAGCETYANTPKDAFREIQGRVGSYVMAVGKFDDGMTLDVIYALASDGSETSTRLIAGQFSGMSATTEGFVTPLETEVEISQRCNDDVCHPMLDGTRYLVFLEQVRGRLEFVEDGCAARAFVDPTPEMLETVIGCMNGACD